MIKSTDRKSVPDFVVIGAMRAGTTSLQNILMHQPNICLPEMKETDYFIRCKNYQRGENWYRNRFARPGLACGDISPNYAKRDAFPEAPELIHAANPDVKIIYIVRDPVDRALSHYRHSYLTGTGMPEPDELLGSNEGNHIVNTSRYFWQLEPWLNIFREDQILLIDFDSLVKDTSKEVMAIGRFIGVDIEPVTQTQKANSSGEIGRMPPWWASLRDSPIGANLRAALPRDLAQKIKATVSSSAPSAVRKPPLFLDTVVDNMRERLKWDTTQLRRLSGQGFSHWTV